MTSYYYGATPWEELHWTRQIRFKAYASLRAAILRGDIPALDEKSICADCGDHATAYEHRNYFYPLTVDPVCTRCNQQRGEGFPPPKGPAIFDKGFDDSGSKGWSALSGGARTIAQKKKEGGYEASSAGGNSGTLSVNRIYDWDSGGFPIWMKAALASLMPNQLKNPIHRGDLRSEYFKQHDPYYQPEMF